MLESMRQLALHHLYRALEGAGDPDEWYRSLRREAPERLFPFLIEPARESMAKNYYVLFPDPHDPQVAVLEGRELRPEDAGRLPFVQSTGSQSPALGPVLKRRSIKGEESRPTAKILRSTLEAFHSIAETQEPWAGYFGYAYGVCARPKLRYGDKVYEETALLAAVRKIPESKTAYLSLLDPQGRLPGEVPEYAQYLQSILAGEKYSTAKYPPVEGQCALTAESGTVYPNALSGAGLNLTNVDREGAFAGLSEANGWKKFPLSAATADLLYTFSFHLRPLFIGRVAGERALILPEFKAGTHSGARKKFLDNFTEYVEKTRGGDKVQASEDDLAYYARQADLIGNLTVIWAEFGQKMEGVSGLITDILPSRLSQLSQAIEDLRPLSSNPVFPEMEVSGLDLSFNHLASLLRRPGGRKNQKMNDGKRLFALKRQVAACAYHGLPFPWRDFWTEALEVARAYLAEAQAEGNTYGLLSEGKGKNGPYLTLAGWVRHLARLVYFLQTLEGTMTASSYTPHREELADFFAASETTAGLDTDPKRYAFLLGALFGRLIQIQEARGVNAAAGALTWLKRLDLTGADLPEVYAKVCGKLLEYENDTDPTVRRMARSRKTRALVEEVSWLGAKLGQRVALSSTEAPYYFLLGKALSRTLTAAKETDDE